ncbi:sugar ABC transporter substrate-binding protein [Sphingomonas ginsenosidimutans]|jgi:ABC-type sugar transport system substrate-binding protein|uniref:L-arabinose-binding periplasmic protein n=2 Tax=Sphingomonas ginsenosidimutans TaxID=862134 RepID=A0A2A4I258_9SPHN|nr:sugar ABC transporter substrate-binding protein [Sphingomonas ginsenosidimutans]
MAEGVTGRRTLLGGLSSVAGIAALGGCTPRVTQPRGVRIGFVVKMPQEQWFQDEWRFARAAARDLGFSLIAIGAEDGDRVLSALWTLYARYAGGFVICTPDPRLGPAIAGFAAHSGMKVMSVDDRLIGPDGAPIAAIPHVGISADAIGRVAGNAAADEAVRRGWSGERTGILRIAYDSLDTGRERTGGAVTALRTRGFARVFDAPQRTTDTEGAFTAAAPILTAHADIDRWIVLGLNDETVVGGVRAAEGLRIAPAAVIGIGIGGSEAAIAELSKPVPTGFFATVLLSAQRHGYDTAAAMFAWIRDARAPAPLTLTSGTLMTRATMRATLAREAAA